MHTDTIFYQIFLTFHTLLFELSNSHLSVLEELSEALLDFNSLADFKPWLLINTPLKTD